MEIICDKYFPYFPAIVCAFRDLPNKRKKGSFRFIGQALSTDGTNVFALIYVQAMTNSKVYVRRKLRFNLAI